jgi:prepilin-type N-terminal cleavage/methylation domain-containing protein
MKNKKGFTLVEMVVVIGIIVILSGAISVTIVNNVQQSENVKANVELHYSDGYNEAKAQVIALRSAKYGDPDGYTADPDTVDPDPVDPDPVDPDPVDPDPVDPDPVDPDPVDPDPVDPDPVDPDPVDPAPVLPQPNPNLSITLAQTNTWLSGGLYYYQYEFTVANISTTTETWDAIVFIVPDGTQISTFYNGTATLDGNLLTIDPMTYNEEIKKSKSIKIGVTITNAGDLVITEYVVA